MWRPLPPAAAADRASGSSKVRRAGPRAVTPGRTQKRRVQDERPAPGAANIRSRTEPPDRARGAGARSFAARAPLPARTPLTTCTPGLRNSRARADGNTRARDSVRRRPWRSLAEPTRSGRAPGSQRSEADHLFQSGEVPTADPPAPALARDHRPAN